MNTRESLQRLLTKLPHHMQVQFAYDCAKEVSHLDTSGEAEKTLSVILRWLKGETVHKKELQATTTSYAANAAAYAASAAAYAAYAANAAAPYAANAAAYAAYAANAAAYAANADALCEYELRLIAMIKGLSRLERIVRDLEDV